MMKQRCFWSALFKNDKLFFLNVRVSEAGEKNLSDTDIQKAISCQYPRFFHDFSFIFKFHDFSMHGIFSAIFDVFQIVGTLKKLKALT